MSSTTVSTLDELKQFTNTFATTLKGGDVVLLSGDLGAGKTAFTKCLAKSLKIDTDITSPTFPIMNLYPVSDHESISQLVHIDTYRLETTDDLIDIGFEDELIDSHNLIVIEWPELAKPLLKDKSPIAITIELVESERQIHITRS